MGRWKPPPPAASPYITASGYQALQDELKAIWIRRRDVVSALSAAAAEGDRSENAEYIYRKKELGSIDYRIRYLQKRLPILNVVTESPANDKVYFSANVELAADDGTIERYRIVGPDETDASTNAISMDSPLARALLGKSVSTRLTAGNEDAQRELTLVAIRYD